MKKGLILFFVNIYLVQISLGITAHFILTDKKTSLCLTAVVILFLLLAISIGFMIVNVVNAFVQSKAEERENQKIFRTVMWFKLGMIPFYLNHCFVWVMFSVAALKPFIMVCFIFIPLGIVYAFMVLIASSAYSVSRLLCLKKSGRLTARQCIFHVVLQLLFAVDVFDCLYLTWLEKRLGKPAI